MKRIIHTLSLIFMSFMCMMTQCSSTSTHPQNTGLIEEKLPRIDLTQNSILNVMLQQVALEENEHGTLYAVIMNGYYEGTIVEIEKRDEGTLETSLFWNGYATVGECTFVIVSMHSDYKLHYTVPMQLESFRMADVGNTALRKPKGRYFYYILGDDFAFYSPGEGWVWSDGKLDE